jgi:hypothetical protein
MPWVRSLIRFRNSRLVLRASRVIISRLILTMSVETKAPPVLKVRKESKVKSVLWVLKVPRELKDL